MTKANATQLMSSRRAGAAAVALGLLAATMAACAEEPAAGPSVLFIGHRHHTYSGGATQKQFLRDLVEQHGFRVAFREQEFAYSNRRGNVSPSEFKKFDVLVYLNPAFPVVKERRLTETFAKQWAAALQFVKDGGGLLYCPWVGDLHGLSVQQCFRDLGLEPLRAIPVGSEAEVATVMQIPWSYTDRLASDHPVAAGVDGLWVPVYHPKSIVWNANSTAFRVSDDWHVVARLGPDVTFQKYAFQGPGQSFPKPEASDNEALPMLATRRLGKGRVAYFGLAAGYHIIGGRAQAYEDIFFNRGIKGRPSHGERLIVNLLKWLAENAQKDPSLRGAATEPDAITLPEFKPTPPMDKPRNFAGMYKGYKGVIGAIGPHSGGKSSVADYAAKAKQLGFDFLVVVEDLDKVTPEQYRQVGEQTKAQTTKEFICLAGFRYRDEVGNRYVTFRDGLSYPDPSLLVRGKRFRTVMKKGQGSGTGRGNSAQWVQANAHHMAIVHYRDQKDLQTDDPYEYGTPPWDIRPYRQFVSAWTHDEADRRIDDMVEAQKGLVDDGQHTHPVALTFLTAASELGKVANGELPFTVYWVQSLDRLNRDTSENGNYLPTTYATEGPIIRRWQWDHRDIVTGGNYWDWTQYYQRWAIGVDSAAGLDVVEVWDGRQLVRRWKCGGAKSFDTVTLVNKHQLTMPMLVVTDNAGKRAVSSGFQWRSHNFYVSWCTDRVNTLSYSALPSDGPWGHSAGTWPIVTQPKGPMWDNLRLDLNLDVLRMPGFDGQASGGSFMSPRVGFVPADGQPRDGRLNRHITWPLGSHEVVIQECLFDHQLLPEQEGPHGWSTLGPLKPTDVLSGKLRYTTFVHWGHEPAPVLVEGEFTFKQDVQGHPHHAPFVVGTISASRPEAGYRLVSVMRTGERNYAFPIFYDDRTRQVAAGPLPHGAYVWYSPSLFGPMGIISLDPKLIYHVSSSANRKFTVIRAGERNQAFRKGDTVRWRYLAVTSGYKDYSGIDTPERIIDLMGIDGTPGYEVKPASGSVVKTEYWLTLAPGNAGAFRGTIEPNREVKSRGLPAALPVVLQGANHRWSAFFWDSLENKIRPIPVAEGKAYAHFRQVKRRRGFFIGHPFVCDDPDVFITVVQTGPKSLYVSAHNTTDQPKTVTIRRSPDFVAMPRFESGEQWTWALPACGEKECNLGPPTPWSHAAQPSATGGSSGGRRQDAK